MSDTPTPAPIGHNQPTVGGLAVEQLRSIIQRVEKLEDEKDAIASNIRQVYAEAKGNGFDTKAIRAVVRLRKMDAADREEQQLIQDTYKRALGMIPELDHE